MFISNMYILCTSMYKSTDIRILVDFLNILKSALQNKQIRLVPT